MARRSSVLALVLLLAACRDGPLDPFERGLAIEPQELDGTLEIAPDALVPGGPWKAGLLAVDLTFEDLPQVHEAWQVHALPSPQPGETLSFRLDLPRPEPEAYHHPYPGEDLALAAYLPGAWVDTNRDGQWQPGEPLVGASLELLVHAVDGPPEPGPGRLMLQEGWYVVSVHYDEGLVRVRRPEEPLALQANLLPPEREPLYLEVLPALGHTHLGLHSLAEYYHEKPQDPAVLAMPFDASAPGAHTWVHVPPPPPDDFYVPTMGGGLSVDVAPLVAFAFLDPQGDGMWDGQRDTMIASSRHAWPPRYLVHLRPTDFTAVIFEQLVGQAAGWAILDLEQDRVVPWREGLQIEEKAAL